MGDLRMGSFHQMEGTIRGHLAEASRPAFRDDRFDEQKQAMINLGVPEAVAVHRGKVAGEIQFINKLFGVAA